MNTELQKALAIQKAADKLFGCGASIEAEMDDDEELPFDPSFLARYMETWNMLQKEIMGLLDLTASVWARDYRVGGFWGYMFNAQLIADYASVLVVLAAHKNKSPKWKASWETINTAIASCLDPENRDDYIAVRG